MAKKQKDRRRTGVCPALPCKEHQSIVENSLDAMYLFQNGKVVLGNDALAKMAGRSSGAEMAGFSTKDFLNLVHPDDRGFAARMIRLKMAGKKGLEQYRFRVLRKDDSVEHFEIKSNRIIFRGKPALVGIIRDVSPEARRQEELAKLLAAKEKIERELGLANENLVKSCEELVLARDSLLRVNADLQNYKADLERTVDARTNAILAERDKLHAVLEGMEEGVAIVNDRHAIVFLNQAMKRLVGDVLGKKCFKSYLSRKSPCKDCPFKTSPPGSKSTEITLKNGKTYLVSRTPLQDLDGTWLVIHVFRDITERKKWEDRLQAINRDLEWKNRQLEEFREYTVKREMDLIRLREKTVALEKKLAELGQRK